MNKGRILFIFVFIFIFISSIPAGAAPLNETVTTQPWTIQTIDNNEPGVINLSSGFGGKYQIPMFSYYRTDTNALALVHKATNATPGNIGPDSSWLRIGIPITSFGPVDGTISNLATFLYGPDTFGVKWVYATTAGELRGITYEFQNDMTYVSRSSEVLVDLDKFGETLIGAPSLQADGRWFRIAFTILDSSTDKKLIYVQKTGELNNSCLLSGTSYYQCDVIDMSIMYIGQPSLQVTEGGKVGIAYEKFGFLKYAYPHEHLDLFPSNCGPGDPKTWRCITINDDANVGSDVQLAFGPTTGRGILYSHGETLGFAQYVGNGGNCGEDGHNLLKENQWQCVSFVSLGDESNHSYSIDIDSKEYPVIAYAYAPDDSGPRSLHLSYQIGHIGLEPAYNWQHDVVDPAPNMDVDNGREVSLALNSWGMGLIAYMQDDNWDPYDPIDRLKIAIQPQLFRIYLPLVVY
jgi:hypothetical protein